MTDKSMQDESIDTREKLEADICSKLNDMARYSWRTDGIYRQAIEWLDRQAAITEREICEQCEWPTLAALPDRSAYNRIAELERERDELQAKLDGKEQLERDSAYMRLPVGADGEIVRIGDVVYGEDGKRFAIERIEYRKGVVFVYGYNEEGELKRLRMQWITHEKPRTIEDVLKEVMSETRLAVNPNNWIVEKYADELRQMIGGDA